MNKPLRAKEDTMLYPESAPLVLAAHYMVLTRKAENARKAKDGWPAQSAYAIMSLIASLFYPHWLQS